MTHVSGTADMFRCLTTFEEIRAVLRKEEEYWTRGFIAIAMQRRSPSLFTPATLKSGEHVHHIGRFVKARTFPVHCVFLVDLEE